MFVKNDNHKQKPLFSGVDELPEKKREQLEASWAGVFYREVFSRIDEEIFSPLYSKDASRPNVPVNVLAGLLILKSGFGWSDQEMYEAFCFNIQVRYALGYRDLSEGHFELRTYYNFCRRLSEYRQLKGKDLMEQMFEQITEEQIEAYSIKTNKQRMDSSQISSNIRAMTRMQLLIEILQRLYRMLSDEDQARLWHEFERYLKGSSGQFIYYFKGNYEDEIQLIGELMNRLIRELSYDYGKEEAYELLVRVFNEHFVVEEGSSLRAKQGSELRADSLQSPYDPEATYRKKNGEGHQGYVINVTETSDEDNPFELIVKVQTEPNNTDDAKMLAEALPDLKKQTDVEEIFTDGGYNSEKVDQEMREQDVIQTQTNMRGKKPSGDKLNLADCEIEVDEAGCPVVITLPDGRQADVEPGRKPERFIARFDSLSEDEEPLIIYFSQHDVDIALRRKRCAHLKASKKDPRAAIEATIGAIKRPFGNDKVPVRGKFRVGNLMIGSAAMVNMRRIWRYEMAEKQQQLVQNGLLSPLKSSPFYFFSRFLRPFLYLCQSKPSFCTS